MREWIAAAALLAGLIAFLAFGVPRIGSGDGPDWRCAGSGPMKLCE